MYSHLRFAPLLTAFILLAFLIFPNNSVVITQHPSEAAPQEYLDVTEVYESVFISGQKIQAEQKIRQQELLEQAKQQSDNRGSVLSAQTEILGTITLIGPELSSAPADPNGSIMIPRIQVNSPIAFDVSVNDKNEYNKALEVGVAHAAGTDKPNDPDNPNTYLFAHSTANEANIARYAAMFTKLDELKEDDLVVLFYQGKRYDYKMAKGEIVPKFDTTILTKQFDFPTLTMQTCYPRGIPQDRYIVTAQLVGVYDR